jgi:putative nucleotidyltransferase with HDIG domain
MVTKRAQAENVFMVANRLSSANRTPALAPVYTPISTDGLRTDTVEIPVKLCNLPPLNSIANQVITLSADPDVDLQKIAAVMGGDPAFAADLLFLANSSLFGFRSRIQVVGHAVSVLGLERIKALAMTVAMRSFLTKGGPLLPRCWQHSAACAIIAEEISPILDVKGDVAYTLGLLHDIGRLGLLKSYPAEYAPALTSPFQNVEEVLNAERAILKVDHCTAGAWMVKTWDFPTVFVEACQHHHEALSPSDSGLIQAVKISCRLAEVIGSPAANYTNMTGYDDVIQALPPHIPKNRFPSAETLRTNVETRLKSFS